MTKKKKNGDDPVTFDGLTEFFHKMIRPQFLKIDKKFIKIDKRFQELDKRMTKGFAGIKNYVGVVVEEKVDEVLEEKFSEKLSYLPSKEEFYKKMDEVMGELKTIREEQAVLSDIKRRVDENEEAIEKIQTMLQFQVS